MIPKLVTIVIPIYRRLNYLPGVLQSVDAQDYSHIELIVSDNGRNGSKVSRVIEEYYSRPYRFRQTAVTVNIPAHYHQVLSEATGEYFVWMPDDDMLSPNYISELVALLEQDPHVSAAIARNEYIDMTGKVLRSSPDRPPCQIPGEQLIEQWTTLGYESFTAILARTAEVRDCGGYPNFPGGTHCDDALLVKLCMNRSIAFTNTCTYGLRIDESSFGWSLNYQSFADDTRRYLEFLNADLTIRAYAKSHPERWANLRQCQLRMAWQTYFYRWSTLYRQRLAPLEWVGAGFALPFIPEYYRRVRLTLGEAFKESVIGHTKKMFPWAQKLYRAIKRGGV